MPSDFSLMRSRWLFLWIAAFVLAALGFNALFHPGAEALAAGMQTLFYVTLFLWVWRQCKVAQFSVRNFVGPYPSSFSAGQVLILTLVLFIASEGCIWLFWIPVSYVLPEFTVEWGLARFPSSWDPQFPALSVINIFFAVIFGPIVEELVFRGVLLQRWTAKWGAWPALTVSSVVFGALHTDVLGGIIFGFVMGFLASRTCGLWVPIAVHIVNNAISLALEFAPEWTALPSALSAFRRLWPYGLFCTLLGAFLLWHFRRLYQPRTPLAFPLSVPQACASPIAV